VRLADFIVCEDIRFEIGNKVTLVGIYGEEIRFAASPATPVVWPLLFRMGIFARVRCDPASLPDRFKISILHEARAIGTIEGPIVISRPEHAIHLTTMNQILMPAPGRVTFKIDLGRGSDHLVALEPDFAFDLCTTELQTRSD
jgi:Family of unknown function (DUF6941)